VTPEQRQHLGAGEKAGLRYALGLPRRTPTGGAGGVSGQRAGSSLEFRDYRAYQPGDDLRHVDWSAYARSDQLSVKLYREEVTPHVDVVVDGSRSMALEGSAKEAATLALAAFFASAATNAGYTHAAWMLGETLRPIDNGTRSPTLWEGIDFVHRDLCHGCDSRGTPWRPRGVRVLLSDLLWESDPLTTLRPFTERVALTVVVQLLAEADVHPAEGGNLRLVDAETEEMREVYVDVAAVRRYRAALARHQENWHNACRQAGAVFTTLVAEQLLRDWHLDELVAAEVLRVV
jgi:uncharacterized protein (DUF58 family)